MNSQVNYLKSQLKQEVINFSKLMSDLLPHSSETNNKLIRLSTLLRLSLQKESLATKEGRKSLVRFTSYPIELIRIALSTNQEPPGMPERLQILDGVIASAPDVDNSEDFIKVFIGVFQSLNEIIINHIPEVLPELILPLIKEFEDTINQGNFYLIIRGLIKIMNIKEKIGVKDEEIEVMKKFTSDKDTEINLILVKFILFSQHALLQ